MKARRREAGANGIPGHGGARLTASDAISANSELPVLRDRQDLAASAHGI
jgi:hypothetical protein